MRAFSLLFFVAILAGCQKPASDEVDFGSFEGSRYTNAFFDFEMTFPEDWVVQDRESHEKLAQAGQDVLAGEDEAMRSVLKAAELQTVNLFAVFENPVGAPVDFNPNIVGVAERLEAMPGIQKGSDYLFHAKRLLASSGMNYSFPSEPSNIEIGGREFFALDADLDLGHTQVRQIFCADLIGDYVFTMTLSFAGDAQKEALLEILTTARFGG